MRHGLVAAFAALAFAAGACDSGDDVQPSPTAAETIATSAPTATPTACPDYAARPAPTPSVTPRPEEGTLLNGFLLLPGEEPSRPDWVIEFVSPYPAAEAPLYRINIDEPVPLLAGARPEVRDEQPLQERAPNVTRDASGKVSEVEVSYTAFHARVAGQAPVLTALFGPSYALPEPFNPRSTPLGLVFPGAAPWLPQPGIVFDADGAMVMIWHDEYGRHLVSWSQVDFPGVTPEDIAARIIAPATNARRPAARR